jgi:putative flippase GtrA
MSRQHALGQFLRYAVVGLASNAILYAAYLALTGIGMEVKLAMTLLYALGVTQTFFFNKNWSFRHGGTHGPAFVRYCISYGLGYVVNLAALFVLVDRLGYPHQIVQGAMVLSIAVMLFLLQKFWVFRLNTTLPTVHEPNL